MTTEQIVLNEIKKNIAAMPEHARIRTEAIAMSIRNIVRSGGVEAHYALALVGAELAAE